MNFTILKTNLNEHNNGHTALSFTNIGNSRYTGQTVCWEVIDDEGCDHVAYSRKKDAERVCAFANESGYEGIGDLSGLYRSWAREEWEAERMSWEEFDDIIERMNEV